MTIAVIVLCVAVVGLGYITYRYNGLIYSMMRDIKHLEYTLEEVKATYRDGSAR